MESAGRAGKRRLGDQQPLVVATIGLHGSASTWVFNVARESLIAAFGETQVIAVHVEVAEALPPPDGRHLVVKSHAGSPGLDAWLDGAGARRLLSIRDPRDAAISMAQRFNAPLAQAAGWVLADCAHLLRIAEAGHPMLRYEDRFFDDPAAAGRVAQLLGLRLEPAQTAALADRYATNAVREFARRLGELPPERTGLVGGKFMMDHVTRILAPHIGDTMSNKWRGLPPPVRAELTRAYGPFLERFGYAR